MRARANARLRHRQNDGRVEIARRRVAGARGGEKETVRRAPMRVERGAQLFRHALVEHGGRRLAASGAPGGAALQRRQHHQPRMVMMAEAFFPQVETRLVADARQIVEIADEKRVLLRAADRVDGARRQQHRPQRRPVELRSRPIDRVERAVGVEAHVAARAVAMDDLEFGGDAQVLPEPRIVRAPELSIAHEGAAVERREPGAEGDELRKRIGDPAQRAHAAQHFESGHDQRRIAQPMKEIIGPLVGPDAHRRQHRAARRRDCLEKLRPLARHMRRGYAGGHAIARGDQLAVEPDVQALRGPGAHPSSFLLRLADGAGRRSTATVSTCGECRN